jgi:lipopolysaccharide heptosyltransferase II
MAISNQKKSQVKRYPFQKSWRWQLVRFFDFLSERLFRPRKSILFPNLVRNILVIRLDHIGDLICALPVFPVLRMRFPNARITVLTSREGQAIFKGNPFIDHIIVFQSNWFSRLKWVNPYELFQIIFQLRKIRYDLGFDLRGDLRNILLMVLAGVLYRVSYGIAGGEQLLHRVRDYESDLHQAELNVRLVMDEPVDKCYLKPDLYLSPEERKAGLDLLKRSGAANQARLIALHPEAGYPSKEWGEGRFKELTSKLTEAQENTVLILGLSKKTVQLAASFGSSGQVIDLTGKLTLREMIAVLSWCHLFIGHDSGPSHIAQALGIPAVVVASGTNKYEKWGLWREPSKIVKHEVPCSPCHLRKCNVEGHPCMSEIKVDEVFHSSEELLTQAVRS